eukprot:160397-Chlamydomonas_euryale.AAC.5
MIKGGLLVLSTVLVAAKDNLLSLPRQGTYRRAARRPVGITNIGTGKAPHQAPTQPADLMLEAHRGQPLAVC